MELVGQATAVRSRDVERRQPRDVHCARCVVLVSWQQSVIGAVSFAASELLDGKEALPESFGFSLGGATATFSVLPEPIEEMTGGRQQ